jgi:hypothetical protein
VSPKVCICTPNKSPTYFYQCLRLCIRLLLQLHCVSNYKPSTHFFASLESRCAMYSPLSAPNIPASTYRRLRLRA